MSSDIPPAPPEAEVIRLARSASGMTAQSAAKATEAHGKGVSATYWRDVERGHGGRRGQQVPVRASDRTLAAMARVVGVQPQQLAGAGREDAAKVLEEIQRRGRPALAIAPDAPASDNSAEVHDAVLRILSDPAERKIWSMTTFTVPERLAAIDGLRKKQAVLEAGLAEDEQGQGSGLASV